MKTLLFQNLLGYAILLLNSPDAPRIVSLPIPLLVATIKKPTTHSWIASLLVLGVCFLTAFGIQLVRLQTVGVSQQNLFQLFYWTTGTAVFAYAFFWKHFGLKRYEQFSTDKIDAALDAVKNGFGWLLDLAGQAIESTRDSNKRKAEDKSTDEENAAAEAVGVAVADTAKAQLEARLARLEALLAKEGSAP